MAAVQMTAEVRQMLEKHIAVGSNPMSVLNYLTQNHTISKPEFCVEGTNQGPFRVRYRVDGFTAEASGSSKKSARTAAAQKLLEALLGTGIAKSKPNEQKNEDDIPIYRYNNGAYFDPFSPKELREPKQNLADEVQDKYTPNCNMPVEHQNMHQSDPFNESNLEEFWRTGQRDLLCRSPARPMRSTMPPGYPMRRFRPHLRLAQPYPLIKFEPEQENNVGFIRPPNVGGFRDPNTDGFHEPNMVGDRDPCGRLNAIAAKHFNLIPRIEFRADATAGYGCLVRLEGYEAYGTGLNKKFAKQNAAIEMLRMLRPSGPDREIY